MKSTVKKTALLLAVLCLIRLPMLAAEPQKTETAQSESAAAETKPPLSPAIRVLAARSVMRKSGVCGTGASVSITQEDFAKVLGYTPSSVTITSLPDPAVGYLKLGLLDIAAGTTLSAGAMNQLCFVPVSATSAQASDAVSAQTEAASFTFTASGKVYETDTALTCMIYLLDAENRSPAAKDLTVTTYADVPLYSSLRAADPEADDITYSVVRTPKKGVITLDAETGAFVYTPDAGKTGSDVFTYRVSDSYGGESALCRVDVKIRRADSKLCYADLENHWCAASAMLLCEQEIMTGSTVGGVRLFEPDKTVTRGEFLVSAMRAAGYGVLSPCEILMFADGDRVPTYMTGYAAAAYEDGILSGSPIGEAEDGAVLFRADDPITRAEAAVLMERLFRLGDSGSGDAVSVFAEASRFDTDAVPAWSADAFSALYAAGIVTVSAPDTILDRAQTAVMLAAAYNLK